MEINSAKCEAIRLGTNNEHFWCKQRAHHLEMVEDRHLDVWTGSSRYPEALSDHRITAIQQHEAEMTKKILEHIRSVSTEMGKH